MKDHPAVEKVRVPLTVQLSPQEIFLALDVQFRPDLQAAELDQIVDDLESKIRQDHKEVGRIFIEVERLKKSQEKQNHP